LARFKTLLTVSLAWLALVFINCDVLAAPAKKIHFVAAGVPKEQGEKSDFDTIFGGLAKSGIDVFMPFSVYQEVPESRSLEYDAYFYPNHAKNKSAIDALHKHKIKILIPAEILYPDGVIPPIEKDPLKEYLKWVGTDSVFGVYSFDEPVQNKRVAACKALYERVKAIDPKIRVVMIHAPVSEYIVKSKEFSEYFKNVKSASEYSDMVGFDIYAIPKDLMKVHGPYTGPSTILDYESALQQHLRWLKENLPDKDHLMILQAFSLRDQGHNFLLAKLYGDRRPTKLEIQRMIQITTEANSSVGWWGQSLIKEKKSQFWKTILNANQDASRSRR